MNLSATVLHNVSRDSMFQPFNPETADLAHAHEFQIVADNVNQAGDLIWLLTNIGDPDDLPAHLTLYRDQVSEYRSRMNRSLSVGDVIILRDLNRDLFPAGVLAVEPVGFKGLEFIPAYTGGSNSTLTSESYVATFQLHS
jgi:hypothetical protein